ncbi:MAG: transglycosylase domain-containing protein [Actinomycetota bacterium]
MSSQQPPRRFRFSLPSPSSTLIRLGLLPTAIVGAALAFALMLLPAARGLGTMAQRFEEQVGCKGTKDIQFPRFPERSTILASDGRVLANIYLDENRNIVKLKRIAHIARRSVLAIEDYQFYQHGGVDWKAIFRAALANIRAGETVQGGSTITQQLVKNVTGNREETLRRKIDEACRAIAVEQQYTKHEILELYLNDIYFGHGLYGIETAAESYYSKHASNLTLAQAATLAGLIAAPGRFDPISHPRSALARRNQVLRRMEAIHWIDPQHAEVAEAKPLGLADTAGDKPEPTNPFFVQYITRQILQNHDGEFDSLGPTYKERKHTLFQGGLKIYTTLNPKWQQEALDTVRSHLPVASDPEAAVSTVEVKTGAIRVLVSGRNFRQSHQDLVTGLGGRAGRQAGSAFKPFTLVAAFREGIPPGKVYNTKDPIFIPECNDWHVSNAEQGLGGYVDLWEATADSINVVFAQLARDVGGEAIAQAAHDMGITANLPPVCSLTLGTASVSPLEMADAYATLANDGVHCPAYAVERIVGPAGKAINRHVPQIACKQVISPDIAHQVTAMLEGVVAHGTGTLANIGRPQAGKTGTNTEYRDAWFVGYVPQYSTAVWVGYPQGEIPMYSVEGVSPAFGGTVAAPIWHDYMAKAVQGLPVESFPAPPAQETGAIPKVVGLLKPAAEKLLADANFTAIATMVPSSEPKGTVVAQSPSAGSHAVLGSAVNISVSTGVAAKVVVPQVTGMTEDDARAALEQAGFSVNVVEVPTSDKKEDGVVLDQDPRGGQKREQGSTVSIAVGHYEKGKGR